MKTRIPSLKVKLLALIRETSRKGEAWNGHELAANLGKDFSQIDHILLDLLAEGQIMVAGRDTRGFAWKVAQKRHKNPSVKATAEKKAESFQNGGPVTKARKINHPMPEAYIEIGNIVAIEYESNKWDGKKRIFRHEATKKRQLHISIDGSTILIKPGFKITKRGIEG